MTTNSPLIIGIAGGTGSGKTTLVSLIDEILEIVPVSLNRNTVRLSLIIKNVTEIQSLALHCLHLYDDLIEASLLYQVHEMLYICLGLQS